MKLFTSNCSALVLMLAAAMLATRQIDPGVLPDASWAVFFLGGFILGSRYLFALFMALAVAVDYIATQHLGVSSYCLSRAYLFVLPAYATLWWGGYRSARHWQRAESLRSCARLGITLVAAVSLCFLISNASFYWLGGRVAAPHLAGWLANFRQWYGYFLAVPCAYVALAAGAYALLRKWGVRWADRALPAEARAPRP